MSGSVADPELLLVRVDTDRTPIWLADGDGRPTASEYDRWRDSIVVDDSRADQIEVADAVDGERVESFLAATDFDAETVFVEMGEVQECFELDLCRIGWSATEISTDYARQSRPYTAHCDVEAWVIEARLIRIPDTIDADDVSGYSSSTGTGVCDPQHDHAEEGDADPSTATDRPTATPTSDSGGGQ